MIVAYINGSALALTDVERNEVGNISKAWVVNGQWTVVIKNGEVQAKESNFIVTRQPLKTIEEYEIKGTGHYNSDIALATDLRKAAHDH